MILPAGLSAQHAKGCAGSGLGKVPVNPPTFVNAAGLVTSLSITLPLKVISEANAMSRRGSPGHWREKLKRKHAQQQEVMAEMNNVLHVQGRSRKFAFPVLVTLTRIGPKRIDPGNLEVSFKAVQDQIAASLGVDDGDEKKIDWKYEQIAVGKRHYQVKIDINSLSRHNFAGTGGVKAGGDLGASRSLH